MQGNLKMESKKHAILSASSSHRWLNCPPSVRLSEGHQEVVSDFAAEGTDAHTLCEYKLRKALDLVVGDHPMPKLNWYSEEMEDCANGYVAYVLELIEEVKKTCTDPIILIEQRLDYSKYVEDGFGTGDCVIIADGIIHIVDYKHGRGVQVEATDNPQMMLYALGALELFDHLYEVSEVSMTIYQPRRSNISTFEMKTKDLYVWVDNVLVPMAKLAYKGEGTYKSGDWCQFCKAKTTCRERANANMKLASFEFAEPALLNDEEIEDVLKKVDGLVEWANDIKTYALQSAISGKKWNGFKLVEGRSVRKYIDDTLVATKVKDAGFDPYEKKLLGITEMQKLLGKSKFDELLSSYLIKPNGKPTLVLESDKRPEFNPAKADFMTNMEEINYVK